MEVDSCSCSLEPKENLLSHAACKGTSEKTYYKPAFAFRIRGIFTDIASLSQVKHEEIEVEICMNRKYGGQK